MKIAISLSGQPYTHFECIETFNLNLYSSFSDVYSHFWWDKSYLNKCYKMHYNMKIEDPDTVKKLVDSFKIFEYKTEAHNEIDLTYVQELNLNTWKGTTLEYNKMMVPILLYGVSSQITSINKSIDLIDKTKYDVIVRTRPDVIYTRDIKSIIKNLNFSKNTIFIQSSNSGGHLYAGEPSNEPCDWFYMGHPETMDIFVKALKESFKHKFKNGVIHLRDFTKSVANDCNIKLELVDFGAIIYKQTPLFDNKYKNNIEIYLNDFDIENMCPKTYDIWPYWIQNVNFKHFKNLK